MTKGIREWNMARQVLIKVVADAMSAKMQTV